MNATRHEHIELNFELDYKEVQQHKEALIALGVRDTIPVFPGDTYKVYYRFFCDYFGDVEEKLKAVLNLLENATIIKAEAKEWEFGQSIVMEIAKLMERVNMKISDYRHPDTVPPKGWWQRLREWCHV